MSQLPQKNRRDFLKTSSAAAIAGGVLASVPTAANALAAGAFAGGDDLIKIGLIGCGGRGSGAAEQALSTEGKVKIVCVGDAFEDACRSTVRGLEKHFGDKKQPERVEVPKERQFVGLDAYKKVIDSDIDLVILATPPGFRPVQFDYAVKAGKHIFSEKPVASDAPGVRMVLAAAEEAKKKNLKIGIGLQRHHQPSYLAALEQLRDGAIGDIIACRAYWNNNGVWDPRITREQAKNEMEYQLRNWYYYTWLCGDHIVEQHIHNIDVCNWWKDAVPVMARGSGGREVRTAAKYGQIFDHFDVQFEYPDGSYMFSECRHIPNTWNSVSEVAHGTKGTLTTMGRMRIEQGGKTKWAFKGENPNPYQVEHDDLFHAIRNDISYSEAENGAMSTMTAILGRMATYAGKEISMEEALNSGRELYPYGDDLSFASTPPVLPGKDGFYPIPVPGQTQVV